MCDMRGSGIRDDTRKSYQCKVEKLSNICGMQLNIGWAYGHKFLISMDCLVWWDEVVKRDGMQGGSSGALYRRR